MMFSFKLDILNFRKIRKIKLIFCKKLIRSERLMIFKCVFTIVIVIIVGFNFFQMISRLISDRIDLLISLNKPVNTLLIPVS